MDAIEPVPEAQRAAVERHRRAGVSTAEVARRITRTDSSVAGLPHRGLFQLRPELE